MVLGLSEYCGDHRTFEAPLHGGVYVWPSGQRAHVVVPAWDADPPMAAAAAPVLVANSDAAYDAGDLLPSAPEAAHRVCAWWRLCTAAGEALWRGRPEAHALLSWVEEAWASLHPGRPMERGDRAETLRAMGMLLATGYHAGRPVNWEHKDAFLGGYGRFVHVDDSPVGRWVKTGIYEPAPATTATTAQRDGHATAAA